MENTILQQVERALNEPMYEWKFIRIMDGLKTVSTEWATESNFIDSHPEGVIVISKTR